MCTINYYLITSIGLIKWIIVIGLRDMYEIVAKFEAVAKDKQFACKSQMVVSKK